MQPALREVLKRRRDRGIAIVMGVVDRDMSRSLAGDQRVRLRKVVLDQFNEFYDLVDDLLDSLDTGVVLNEEYLHKLDELHRVLVLNGAHH